MDIHPAAAAFPMMSDHELDSMAEDIKRNGLRSPIVTWHGFVVDGRNRLAALAKTLSEPRYVELDGYEDEGDVVRWIISTNIHRRHLTVDQRADIADELAKLPFGSNQHTMEGASKEAPSPVLSQGEAAKAMGVSRSTVQRIHAVKESAPDLAAKVKSGEIKVSKAASMARERQRQSAPVTNPDNADDAVVEKKIETAASGYTPKMEKVWAGYAALDAVEQTAFRERMES